MNEKLFYSEEELKKHEDERTRICVTCGRCLTPDMEEYRYCMVMERFTYVHCPYKDILEFVL